MHSRSRAPAVAMVLAGVLLFGAALWWIGQNRTHPPAFDSASDISRQQSAGTPPAPVGRGETRSPAGLLAATTATATVRPAAPSAAAPSGSSAAAHASPPARSTAATVSRQKGGTTAAPAPTGAPVEVTIPALGVRAPVDPVLNAGGVLRPPDDPGRLGWWIGSALPGAARGSIVIAGHVDSAQDGPGALYRLAELPAAGEISVRSAGGAPVAYRVTARQFYAKSQGLPADLFSFDGPPRLVLITCGGQFDETTGSYEENVVVTADPT